MIKTGNSLYVASGIKNNAHTAEVKDDEVKQMVVWECNKCLPNEVACVYVKDHKK